MKKIIAIVLALVCCFSIISCKKEEPPTGVDLTLQCYAKSQPTKIESVTVQNVIGDDNEVIYALNGTSTLLVGTVGGKMAAVKTTTQDLLKTTTAGSGATVEGPFETEKTVEEYLEGLGRRTNGGSWRSKGLNFAPAKGDIAINITNGNVTNPTYTEAEYNNQLTFTVAKDKIAEVFGTKEDGTPMITSDSDITVTITNNGALVTGITVSYSMEGDGYDFPARNVTVTTNYYYDSQVINIEQ